MLLRVGKSHLWLYLFKFAAGGSEVTVLCVVCFFSLPHSQGHSLPGGLGLYQVWPRLVLQNTDPLCDPLAAVFGKSNITGLVNNRDESIVALFCRRRSGSGPHCAVKSCA